MHWIDWVLVTGYFAFILGFATWISMRARRKQAMDSASFFLSGRDAGWWVIGASLFAANIGSEHLVGLAGTGAASGVAVGQFEIAASLILLLLGWLFVPFYLRNGVFTMPEFLERRYSAGSRWYLSIISIIAYVLTKISVTIAAGGIVFEAIMGINFWAGAVAVVAITGIYTLLGGLRAVLYTDFIQIFVIIAGSLTVTLFGLDKAGGWSEVHATAGRSFFNMWTNPDFPWTGLVIGVPILGVWYWCTDQFIVQRVLSARNFHHARGGTVFGGFLKILPLFLFVIPGIIAHALAQKGMLELEDADAALPTMVAALLPVGFRGLVVAGLLAALTSSLASVFNSCSTLITFDIYKKLKPDATERSLVRVGRVATGFLILCGLAWIPLMKLVSGELYKYLQSVQAYISPPITAVFLVGLFSPRVNGRGALAALLTGFVLGTARLVLELNAGALGPGPLRSLVEMNFLHFAGVLFAFCSVVLVLVSLLTPAPDRERLRGLTLATGVEGEVREKASPLVIAASVLLLVTVLAIWVVFSSWGVG
ncbi:sodium:solute symporter [Kiritimatiella glycovorans]|uniref:Na(+)/glucose symporter n=1 Tax=Kiritimatiella glycovorans TaxID=1307763 RepID=A0A0G3EGC7_9BACT|nr:sodium:solute symporter [Kiritimatiella glycovorans]AKJ64462.1 Na(+)/glucose symporter [Kiritimatiella glycovorans]